MVKVLEELPLLDGAAETILGEHLKHLMKEELT
jgi:hypothetical protein